MLHSFWMDVQVLTLRSFTPRLLVSSGWRIYPMALNVDFFSCPKYEQKNQYLKPLQSISFFVRILPQPLTSINALESSFHLVPLILTSSIIIVLYKISTWYAHTRYASVKKFTLPMRPDSIFNPEHFGLLSLLQILSSIQAASAKNVLTGSLQVLHSGPDSEVAMKPRHHFNAWLRMTISCSNITLN